MLAYSYLCTKIYDYYDELYWYYTSPLCFYAISWQTAGCIRQPTCHTTRLRKSCHHKSGTDRIEEACEKIGTNADVIINIQGDEPFVATSQIETLKALFDHPQTQIGTLGKRFESMEAAMNPNSPKIVTDRQGFALYFSRSVIPFVRGKEQTEWLRHFPYLKHLGIYAYRREILREVTQLPQSPLELAESLEQLRWLENGYRIRVGITDVETVGIDTPEDLQRAEEFLKTIQKLQA